VPCQCSPCETHSRPVPGRLDDDRHAGNYGLTSSEGTG
jgi:hypothetical protein